MKTKNPIKVYVMTVRTGKKQNEFIFFKSKKDLDSAVKKANKDDIEYALLVG